MTKITLEGLPVISVETKNTVLQESAREPEATNRYVKRFRQENPHLHDALILSFKLLNYSPDLIQGASEELAFSYEFLARELENNYPTRRLPLVDISTGLEECAIASRNLDYNEEVNKRLEKENGLVLDSCNPNCSDNAFRKNFWIHDFTGSLLFMDFACNGFSGRFYLRI